MLLREINGRIPIQEQGKMYVAIDFPKPTGGTWIDLRRTPELGWCWEMEGRVRSTKETAETIVSRRVDRVERAAQSTR